MEDPIIKAYLAKKAKQSADAQAVQQLAADAAQILSFAATVRGRSYATVSELFADLSGKVDDAYFCRLVKAQVDHAIRLALTTEPVPLIAARVGCTVFQVRGLIAHHNARPQRKNPAPLTDDQKAKLRALGTTDKPIRLICVEVPCTRQQARGFYEKEPRR